MVAPTLLTSWHLLQHSRHHKRGILQARLAALKQHPTCGCTRPGMNAAASQRRVQQWMGWSIPGEFPPCGADANAGSAQTRECRPHARRRGPLPGGGGGLHIAHGCRLRSLLRCLNPSAVITGVSRCWPEGWCHRSRQRRRGGGQAARRRWWQWVLSGSNVQQQGGRCVQLPVMDADDMAVETQGHLHRRRHWPPAVCCPLAWRRHSPLQQAWGLAKRLLRAACNVA